MTDPLRCPVCRADNSAGPTCRRCKADLSLLFALEDERRRLIRLAATQAVRGERTAALTSARRADDLRRDDESRRLLAAVLLLNGAFAEALATARRTLA